MCKVRKAAALGVIGRLGELIDSVNLLGLLGRVDMSSRSLVVNPFSLHCQSLRPCRCSYFITKNKGRDLCIYNARKSCVRIPANDNYIAAAYKYKEQVVS